MESVRLEFVQFVKEKQFTHNESRCFLANHRSWEERTGFKKSILYKMLYDFQHSGHIKVTELKARESLFDRCPSRVYQFVDIPMYDFIGDEIYWVADAVYPQPEEEICF